MAGPKGTVPFLWRCATKIGTVPDLRLGSSSERARPTGLPRRCRDDKTIAPQQFTFLRNRPAIITTEIATLPTLLRRLGLEDFRMPAHCLRMSVLVGMACGGLWCLSESARAQSLSPAAGPQQMIPSGIPESYPSTGPSPYPSAYASPYSSTGEPALGSPALAPYSSSQGPLARPARAQTPAMPAPSIRPMAAPTP